MKWCFTRYTVGKFWFFLCLRVKFHKSLFWVPILAAGGPYWVPISQKVCPYFKAWGSLLVFASVQLFNWRWPSSFISTTFLSMICSLYTVHTCLFEIQTDTRAEQDYYSSRTCSAVHRPQGYKRQSGKSIASQVVIDRLMWCDAEHVCTLPERLSMEFSVQIYNSFILNTPKN